MTAEWPIIWPDDQDPEGMDALHRERAEQLAAQTLRMLTMYRVGGNPITVLPCSNTCSHRNFYATVGRPTLGFHPYLTDSGMYANCFCAAGCSCASVRGVRLATPIGRIDRVVVDGITVEPSTYHLEDDQLVRNDGGGWPTCGRMEVTYLNAHPVDTLASYIGGVMAEEFLRAVKKSKVCRLPAAIRTISRAGVNVELSVGMFPDGMTGIAEVDSWIVQWNPHGLKTRPTVHSPDHKPMRQIRNLT